jgi:hypothetical protein
MGLLSSVVIAVSSMAPAYSKTATNLHRWRHPQFLNRQSTRALIDTDIGAVVVQAEPANESEVAIAMANGRAP